MTETPWQGTFDVPIELTVRVRIDDTRIASRILEPGWRHTYTDQFNDLDDLLATLAWHAVNDGVRDICDIDGWADIAPGKCTLQLDRDSFPGGPVMADTTKVRNQLATRNTDSVAVAEQGSTATVVRAAIDRQSGAFRQVLPAGVDPDRFSRLVLTAVKATPDLMRCFATPQGEMSVLLAAMQCAAVGLEPNTPTQDAWLLPRQRHGVWECELSLGYRGQLKLARRSGTIQTIFAEVVRQHDTFEWWRGLEADHLLHRPADGDRGALQYVYAVARFHSGGYAFEVLSKAQVESRRALSDSWRSEKARQYSPWTKWPEAMWRKTALRALIPYLDLTPEAAGVMRTDETRVGLDDEGITIVPDGTPGGDEDSGDRPGTDDGGTVVEPGPVPSGTPEEGDPGA